MLRVRHVLMGFLHQVDRTLRAFIVGGVLSQNPRRPQTVQIAANVTPKTGCTVLSKTQTSLNTHLSRLVTMSDIECLQTFEKFKSALLQYFEALSCKNGARTDNNSISQVIEFVQGAKQLLFDLGFKRIKKIMDAIEMCTEIPSQTMHAWTLCSLTGRPTEETIVIDSFLRVCTSLKRWVCSVWVVTNMKTMGLLQKESAGNIECLEDESVNIYFQCFECVVSSLQNTFNTCTKTPICKKEN